MAFAILVALNAAYLAALTSQTDHPGPITSWMATAGLFPFDASSGTLSIEDYCPFGPVEGVVRFVTSSLSGAGTSFVGPVTLRNLGILLSVLVLALFTKKTFCSWICPFGAVFESVGWLGRKLGIRQVAAAPRKDALLRRVPVLVLIVTVSITALDGTLVFKTVDPFYALFSIGSDTRPWAAYVVLAVLLAAAFASPAVWCRFLCPMGVCLSPFSRIGLIRVTRTHSCTGCGACSRACPQKIPVHETPQVKAGACTNCLNCLDACPADGAMELRLQVGK